MFWIQLYSGKRTVTGAVTGEMKLIESKILDSTIADFSYKNALSSMLLIHLVLLVDKCQPDPMHTCICTQAQHHSLSCSML